MAKKLPFALVYGDEVKRHLRAIETKYHSLIQSEVEAQLLFEPEVETRNRKPLQRPMTSGAEWELRLGPGNRFRVFYQVVVTRNGKPVAVLLAVTDEDELERLMLAHSPKFQAILEKSRRQIEETGGIPHDVFWREVEAESRADGGKGKRGRHPTKKGN
jgi:antitoxin (DNA-binding transcriptional repressor) of toxin-antitoxin stability system